MASFLRGFLVLALWALVAAPCFAQIPATASFRKQLLDSLRVEADRKTNTVTGEAHIATVSLIAAPRYPLFSNAGAGTVFADRFFVLREVEFDLENGLLYRVDAEGDVVSDNAYKERAPDPTAAAWARQQVAAANAARKQEADARRAAAAAKKRADIVTNAATKANLLRAQRQLLRSAASYQRAASVADSLLQRAVLDSTAVALPLNDPATGPRISIKHKYPVLQKLHFTNRQAVIDLNNVATNAMVDVLQPNAYTTTTPDYALRFLDMVQVQPTSGRRLVPDNASWKFNPNNTTTYKLTAGAPLGGLLDVALYTDLLAALNNEDNGLVTTEIGCFLPLNQRLLKPNSNFRLLGAVRPSLTLARLDSKFDTLRMKRDSLLDRPNLLQRSYLRFGINLNLLTYDNRHHVSYHLNASWTRTLSRVAGLGGTTDTANIRTVYQNLYGLEALLTIRRQRNFGADLYFTAYLHNVQSRRYIENNGAEYALRPGALFYYYPFGSPNNKLFLRVSNFIFPQGRQRDFVQLQVGYSIGLSGLFQGQSANSVPSLNETSPHVPSPQ